MLPLLWKGKPHGKLLCIDASLTPPFVPTVATGLLFLREHVVVFGEIAALRDAGPKLQELQKQRELLDEAGQAELDALLRQYRIDSLRIGAAGQLYLEGKLDVLPVESDEAHRAANPVDGDAVAIDETTMAARDDAIVRNLMRGPPVAVVVLGAAHNLASSINGTDNMSIEYVQVITDSVQDISR